MGYSWYFSGRFRISPRLEANQVAYLQEFAEIRHETRDVRLLRSARDPIRRAVELPIGAEGSYFVGTGPAPHGQRHKRSVIDTNRPPSGLPGLWCDWVPEESGQFLVWDEGDKFYNFIEWLEYLIAHFFVPWGRTLSGDVSWFGEDEEDVGTIRVRNNTIDVIGSIAVRRRNATRRLRIFLCHASEDKRKVRALASRLRDDNIDVWLDEKRLLAGSDWELEIRKALRDSDAVVLCLSSVSVKKRGYVQREIRMALTVADEEPEGELFLFPVRLDACDVPDSLRSLQRLDLQRRGGYARLLAALASRAQSLSKMKT